MTRYAKNMVGLVFFLIAGLSAIMGVYYHSNISFILIVVGLLAILGFIFSRRLAVIDSEFLDTAEVVCLEPEAEVNSSADASKESDLIKDTIERLRVIVSSYSEIGESIEEIASGATDQAVSMQSIMSLFTELEGAVNNAVDESWELVRDMETVGSSVNVGTQAMKELESKISEFTNTTKAANENINKLIKTTEAVWQSTKAINGISSNISLLSLNARIEAAKAGQYGAGFAVIAQEVDNLARSAKEATKNIDGVVGNIKREVAVVLESMQQTDTELELANVHLSKTNDTFGQIKEAVNSAAKRVDILQGKLDIVSEQNEAIQPNIENVAAITEQHSASAEEASAVFEEGIRSGNETLEDLMASNV